MNQNNMAEMVKDLETKLNNAGFNVRLVAVDKDGRCKNCGPAAFRYEQKGKHLGKYCAQCGAWLSWVKQGD